MTCPSQEEQVLEQFSKYVGLDVHKETIAVSIADAGRAKARYYGTIKHSWSTPPESAAFGCVGVLLLAAAYRKLTVKNIIASVEGALRVTVMALLIIFGSATFSSLLALSGASAGLINWATGFELAPIVMLLIMFGILLILGMFRVGVAVTSPPTDPYVTHSVIRISELNTRPANSLHPASDTTCWWSPSGSLPVCWLSVNLMGLSPIG